jgi:ubiquinone/menaquinone biosynthesis C-methylase UbiE
MNISIVIFAALNLRREEVHGKRIIEVGACDVNGSLRRLVNAYNPSEYIGVDIANGPGVDIVCDASELLNLFPECSFDFVISTEMIEHVRDWRLIIHNMKKICKPGGVMLITSRSYGFFYHGYPYDFWRYELDDMKNIFQDFDIEVLEKDPQYGVMVKMRKPQKNFTEVNLEEHKLYSIIIKKRVKDIKETDLKSLRYIKIVIKERIRHCFSKIVHFLRSV